MTWAQGNPFSTRYVQPGSLPYLFPEGVDADQLVDRLCRADWRGQLIGPHGSGKSTLLHTLKPRLLQTRSQLAWYTLRGGQRQLPKEMADQVDTWESRTLVIIDGYEQLGWYARRQLNHRCRRSAAGLLVTSHTPRRLPIIYQLAPALPTVQTLVNQLTQDHADVLSPKDIAACFDACNGNVREVLFALYDLYELRRHDLNSR